MRDPNRIYEFCDKLAEIWAEKCPDWRFTQLMSNVFDGRDLFYMEEDRFIKEVEGYFGIAHEE